MNKNIIYRIIVDISIAIFILQGWWFVALPILLVSAWKFPGYVEIVVAGIAYDSLFNYSTETASLLEYVGVLTTTAIFVCLFFVKQLLRK